MPLTPPDTRMTDRLLRRSFAGRMDDHAGTMIGDAVSLLAEPQATDLTAFRSRSTCSTKPRACSGTAARNREGI